MMTNETNGNVPSDGKTTSNKEWKNGLQELEYMVKHPEEYKSFHSVEELMEDLNTD